MNPIYYKSKNGGYFGVKITTNVAEYVDQLLDEVNSLKEEFATKEEFEAAYDKYMMIDLYDSDKVVVIGHLLSKYIDLRDSIEYEVGKDG